MALIKQYTTQIRQPKLFNSLQTIRIYLKHARFQQTVEMCEYLGPISSILHESHSVLAVA